MIRLLKNDQWVRKVILSHLDEVDDDEVKKVKVNKNSFDGLYIR